MSINLSANAETLQPHIPSINFPVRSRSCGRTEYKRNVTMRHKIDIERQPGYKYFRTISTYNRENEMLEFFEFSL